MRRSSASAAVPFLLLLSGCGAISEINIQTGTLPSIANSPAPTGYIQTDAQITNALVDLVERKDRLHVDLSKAEGTPVWDVLTVGSPIGYALRNRFLNLGIPLGEALSKNADPVFRDKLITLARWDSNPETRAAALVALAGAHDPAHLDVFKEAMIALDPAVRFGALEALIVWGQPDKATPLLSNVAERDYEPILRVYAAGGLARLGDPGGLLRLRAALDDQAWLIRGMAARYLGDYGQGEDYSLLVSRIGRETTNDFVLAEYCIAALKLFPKKEKPR